MAEPVTVAGPKHTGAAYPLAVLVRRGYADERSEYCYACYTGDYPAQLDNIEALNAATERRG